MGGPQTNVLERVSPAQGDPDAEVGRPRHLIPNVGSNRKTVSFRDYGTLKGSGGRGDGFGVKYT